MCPAGPAQAAGAAAEGHRDVAAGDAAVDDDDRLAGDRFGCGGEGRGGPGGLRFQVPVHVPASAPDVGAAFAPPALLEPPLEPPDPDSLPLPHPIATTNAIDITR